jgi:nucleolar protein 58
MNAMVLGLSHSLSRYKLKFSPDKVDTMIVQAIALLDDLDKELNTYAMRVKEWYGWHFPEMGKVLVDNLAYAKTIKAMGFRTNCSATDFSSILPEEIESEIKVLAEVSMGTEISDEDMTNIAYLADQVISISEYRAQLFDYLKNRMMAIAPNLTALVGELVGARLIAHAGSLLSLAKAPASTVQILGAEKALFRALKSKHDTPKYGLIYHASLIGQAGPKLKGKMARVVAAKTSLAVRCDAMGEGDATPDMGLAARAKIEARLRQLEGKAARGANSVAGTGKSPQAKFEMKGVKAYNSATDAVMTPVEDKAEEEEETPVKAKKEKKEKKEKKTEESPVVEDKKDKKKKRKADEEADGAPEDKKDKKKKSKKKSTEDDA